MNKHKHQATTTKPIEKRKYLNGDYEIRECPCGRKLTRRIKK